MFVQSHWVLGDEVDTRERKQTIDKGQSLRRDNCYWDNPLDLRIDYTGMLTLGPLRATYYQPNTTYKSSSILIYLIIFATGANDNKSTVIREQVYAPIFLNCFVVVLFINNDLIYIIKRYNLKCDPTFQSRAISLCTFPVYILSVEVQ